jgi:hypothetical protein
MRKKICCANGHKKHHPFKGHSEGRPNSFYALKERVRVLERTVKMLCEWREVILYSESNKQPKRRK